MQFIAVTVKDTYVASSKAQTEYYISGVALTVVYDGLTKRKRATVATYTTEQTDNVTVRN